MKNHDTYKNPQFSLPAHKISLVRCHLRLNMNMIGAPAAQTLLKSIPNPTITHMQTSLRQLQLSLRQIH